jgi:hypothetical protein
MNVLAAFAGRNTGHHLGSVINHVLGKRSGLAPGYALYDNSGILISQYRHLDDLPSHLHLLCIILFTAESQRPLRVFSYFF